MIHRTQAGFTLLELLVVIAIIGVLSITVLVALNSARDKSRESAIRSQMGEMQKVAALYFSDNGNFHGTDSNGGANDDIGECTGGSSVFTDGIFTESEMITMILAAREKARELSDLERVYCAIGGSGVDASWAFTMPIEDVSGANDRGWCVDGFGNATEVVFDMSIGYSNNPLGGGAAVAQCP